jgi:hypothetical protein
MTAGSHIAEHPRKFFVREEYEERHDANHSGAHCKVASKQMGSFGH